MTNPKVSVIVPVYNAERYLERCLESLCRQTLSGIELICVDDGSTDGSLAILRRYASIYPQMRVSACERNQGESAARNCGLRLARGEYLGFVDNDDAVELDFFEKLYVKAKACAADVVKGNVREIDYDGRATYSTLNEQIREAGTRYAFARHWWSAIYRRAIVESAHIRFLAGCPLGGDALFLNEFMLSSTGLEFVDDAIYHYHRRKDSGDSEDLTFDKVKSVLEVHLRIVDNLLAAGARVDDAGRRFVCTWSFANAFTYACRNRKVETLKYCIDVAFDLYQRANEWIQEDRCGQYPVVMAYFADNDRQGLCDFMLDKGTGAKLILANLRYLHRKDIR